MIGLLKGSVALIRPPLVTLDVNGVGYNVFVPVSLFGYLDSGSEITLFVYTLVREDRIHLYGFKELSERDLFEILLSVPGLGAHSSLLLLSHISPEELISAVKNEDTSVIVRIPGIGNKKAEKIIFELKAREKKISKFFSQPTGSTDSHKLDAVAALCSLGFDEKSVIGLYSQVYVENDTIEVTIKKMLRVIAENK